MRERTDGEAPTGLAVGLLRAFAADERGVSTAVGYVLALAIMALLISGLLLAGGSFLEDQRQQVSRDELGVVGGRVAGGVVDADRLAGASGDDALVYVRVSLPDRTADATYSINVTNETDPAALPAQPYRYHVTLRAPEIGVSQVVRVRTHHELINGTTTGGDVVVAYLDADGDGDRELAIRKGVTIPSPDGPALLAQHAAVYVADGTGSLSSLTDGGAVRTYDASNAVVLGPSAADFDGDGLREVPYVTSGSTLKLIDANNQTGTLTSDPDLTTANARLAVGRWHGSALSVFYAADGPNQVYRVAPGATPTLVVEDTSNGVSSPVGAADVDGDGADEFVYLDDSQQLRYLDDDGSLVEINNGGAGQNYGPGVGDPADFDGDGTARVPFVDGSNNLELIDGAGNTETLVAGGVAKAPVASADVDDDGQLEVVYLDGDQLAYVDDVAGTPTTRPLETAGGSSVTVDQNPGVS